MAIDAGTSVQKVDYPKLRQRLIRDAQILDWTEPPPKTTGKEPLTNTRDNINP